MTKKRALKRKKKTRPKIMEKRKMKICFKDVEQCGLLMPEEVLMKLGMKSENFH